MATPRMLLTGATGFIGGHILQRLLTEDVEIVAVNRAGSGPHGPRVTWRGADLRDPDTATALIAEVRPTHLIHSAWMAVPGRFWTDPENHDWLKAGVAMVRAFGESGGQHLTGIGTCAEYDPTALEFVEGETPIRPPTLYGQVKARMWTAMGEIGRASGFDVAWLRVFLPYGPGDHPKRLIPSVIASLRAGERMKLSEGTQERDFIFAPDVADLVVRLALGGHAGAFNAGTGRGTRVRDAVDFVAARLGGGKLLDFGARPMPDHEPARLVADMTKVEATLGWKAQTTLEAGLAALLQSQ